MSGFEELNPGQGTCARLEYGLVHYLVNYGALGEHEVPPPAQCEFAGDDGICGNELAIRKVDNPEGGTTWLLDMTAPDGTPAESCACLTKDELLDVEFAEPGPEVTDDSAHKPSNPHLSCLRFLSAVQLEELTREGVPAPCSNHDFKVETIIVPGRRVSGELERCRLTVYQNKAGVLAARGRCALYSDKACLPPASFTETQ